MRRVFPLIVLLITLSVLGILFIQMQWIKSALKVKQDQYAHSRQKALLDMRNKAYDLFLHKRFLHTGTEPVGDASKQHVLDEEFTVQVFSTEEMEQIVQDALRSNGIKQPYEFGVANIFRSVVLYSEGFKQESIPEAMSIPLTNANAAQQEILYIYISEPKSYLIERMGWMILASVVFTAIIIWAFALTVRTLFTQKKLSEIKSDFINNMTHELKTPLATISLAVDALTNNKVIGDEEKIRYYSAMIKDENRRMNKQVETILQAARIERQEITLNRVELDAHEIIRKTADNLALLIGEKQGALELHLKAPRHMIYADEVHFSNIIFNLLDNAIKYAKNDGLRIDVETGNSGQMLSIRIKDNGIGMNKETQSHIFEKFYRAHTGNIHNVKGFGLGLSYVKAMAEAHGGRVRVESILGKGSTFIVLLPLMKKA
jgi:two-component system phosphate regulon sensor histidine kinase PhoR